MNLNDLSEKGFVLGRGRASHRPSKFIKDDTSDYYMLSGHFSSYRGSAYVLCEDANLILPRLDILSDRDLPAATVYANEHREMSKDLPVVSFSDLGYSMDGKSLVILETTKAGNLFHFMTDVMGKMAVAAEFLPISKSIFLLFAWQSFHREALECAGLSYKIINWANVYTGDCFIPSLAGRATFMPKFTVNFLRNLYSHIPAHDHSGILYISRNNSKTRRMINEEELLAKLSILGMPILKVYLEDYSFPEKIALFKGSKLVIGPHGSGLSFLPFVNEGYGILEIFGPYLQSPHYESMAHQCFLNYRSVGAEQSLLKKGIMPDGWEKDYSCNPSQVIDNAKELLQS